MKETTYQQMYEIMEENGWEKISFEDYLMIDNSNKNTTARIGTKYFKLKKSIKQIKREHLATKIVYAFIKHIKDDENLKKARLEIIKLLEDE